MTPRRRPFRRLTICATATFLFTVFVAACGGDAGPSCEKSLSVSGYIVDLSQGLDNRSESEYAQFRLDSLDVDGFVASLSGRSSVDDQTRAAATVLHDGLARFFTLLDDYSWDLSRASTDAEVIGAWKDVITPASLNNANIVEAWIISKCGLPSRVTSSGDGPVRLPDPSIPSPTATDPPTGPVNEVSEQQALGTVVATLFSLSLTPVQTLCLGRELSGVVDAGDAGNGTADREQYQAAFDTCGIRFRVPAQG